MSSTINNSLNSAKTGVHPSVEILAQFSSGRLEEARVGEIESHLEQCPSCCQSLANVSRREDRFVAELVSAAESTDQLVDPTSRNNPRGQGAMPSSTDAVTCNRPCTIGRFEVRGEIGHGGFGVVLLAHDPQLRREVAVKIPRTGSFLTPELRARFLREAQAAAALDHPNIVPIHEAGEADGICYIASGYCPGTNLAAWLKQQIQPVGFEAAARLVAHLADAVEHAHSRGVLHRDLKPSNVLLEEKKGAGLCQDASPGAEHKSDLSDLSPFSPKITDFGLAKLDGDGPDTTRSNIVMGTVGYMSPEQARGKSKEITEATDIYSLGAILYELLTGRPPMVGDSDVETLQRLQIEEPIPPVRLRPKLPRDVETICLKCLEKEPRRRHARPSELASDLRRFLEGQPIHARPIGALGRANRWCSRNPLVASLSASLASALLLLVVGAVAMAIQINREARRELDHKYTLCLSDVANASATRHKQTAGHRFDSLELLSEAAQLASELDMDERVTRRIRDEIIACLTLADLQLERKWNVLIGRLDSSRFSCDSLLKRCALLRSNQIVILSLDNRPASELILDPSVAEFDMLAMSPDGRFVASRQSGDAQQILLWELDPAVRLPAAIETTGVACFSFDEAGQCLGLVDQSGTIWLYDLKSRELSKSICLDRPPRGCCFDRQGTRMAVWGGARIDVVDLRGQQVIKSLVQSDDDQVQCAVFGPDGWLITGSSHHLAYAWHLGKDTESPVHTLKGHQGWVVHLTLSRDGNLLATSSKDGTMRLWDYRRGRELVVSRGYALRFSADGQRLAALLDDSVGIFRVSSGAQRRTWHAPSSSYEMSSLRVFADGELAAGTSWGGVEFWEVRSGRYLAFCEVGDVGWAEIRRRGEQFELFTGSDHAIEARLLRWDRAEGRIEFGDPRPLDLPERCYSPVHRGTLSRNGQILAVVNNTCGGCLVDLSGSRPVRPIDHPQLDRVRLSDNGEWLASFDSSGRGIQVCRTETGSEAVALLADEPVHSALFSPDGQWLVIDTRSQLLFIDVGTWELSHRTIWERPGVAVNYRVGLSFTADSGLLAVSRPTYEIKLVDPCDGRLLATLPSDVPETNVCFPKDGSRLLCSGIDLTVQEWDLATVRKQLAAMGLAW